MGTITQIKQLIHYLPEKDIELCNKLLDKRQFVELKEIIDSDIFKIGKKRNSLEPKRNDQKFTERYIKIENQYNNLKVLQDIVTEQAIPFMYTLTGEENYWNPNYD